MNDRNFKHKNKTRLCYCCDTLQTSIKKLNIFTISNRGYGSSFDLCNFTIQLCKKCSTFVDIRWFDEEPNLLDGYCEDYIFEELIRDFINSWIIDNQEYIWNHCDNHILERQDWIDIQNDNLSDEKYEKYGMQSPRQLRAYEERFPTCEYPVNIIYNDGSRGCQCPFGARGKYGQVIETYNQNSQCYECSNYIKRKNTLLALTSKEYYEYEMRLTRSNLIDRFTNFLKKYIS